MYIDFHTHILPGIDDGAQDIESALTMLGMSYECGAETVVLTPHVSSSGDIDEFLYKRKRAIDALKAAVKEMRQVAPKMLLGAEVALDGALSDCEDVRSLCIEGTELLMIELPYAEWNFWYNNEIYNLMAKHNVTPVMAHIERYIKNPKDIEKLSTLITLGVKFQINAPSFLSASGRRIIRELAAEGLISAIGSDCHDLLQRSPDITKALNVFEKKFGGEFLGYIYDKTSTLLEKYKIK